MMPKSADPRTTLLRTFQEGGSSMKGGVTKHLVDEPEPMNWFNILLDLAAVAAMLMLVAVIIASVIQVTG
jgi:hypothetical protein